MIRRSIAPRAGVAQQLAREGMLWQFDTPEEAATEPSPDKVAASYWPDNAYYEFTSEQIDALEAATEELWSMCLVAAEYLLTHETDASLALPPGSLSRIRRSWDASQRGIYARFDLCWSPAGPKMLEINGDTPTMLIESAVSQWSWHETNFPHLDQFNSIHERLVAGWSKFVPAAVSHSRGGSHRQGDGEIAFCGILDLVEEAATLAYLADTAEQAGLRTRLFDLRDLGVQAGRFVDNVGTPLGTVFKLYPWEDMLTEPFGPLADRGGVTWIEPMWRSLLSTKAVLPALWTCFPDHPLLLPAYRHGPGPLSEWVAKPFFGREGEGIRVHADGADWTHHRPDQPHDGAPTIGGEPVVFQQWCPLPNFDGNRPVIGSWVIDGHPAGIGIRETDGPITDSGARFIPHVIDTPAPSDAQRQHWLAEDGALMDSSPVHPASTE